MSKMSQLHAELTGQAIELGFESLEEALANGYEVDYEEQELVNPYVLCDKAHEEAHEAWVKERDELLERLEKKQDKLKKMLCDDTGLYALITDTIDFIRGIKSE